jgi:hypothetical protein
MATIDLREFDDSSFVLHFGGLSHEVDALTFGSALVSIAGALRALNREINPGYSLEVAIDALGAGSFRARLKTEKKSLANLFSTENTANWVIGGLVAILLDRSIFPPERPIIKVSHDMVIVQNGDDRVIIPKEVFDKVPTLERSVEVNQNIAKAMEALENDRSVKSFGITKGMNDPAPLIDIPREVFPVIRQNSERSTDDTKRHYDTEAVLTIHKAVFEKSKRKWEFVWNGFKISAPILDDMFFERLVSREISISQGDAIEATLRVHQVYDKVSEIWINESYEVLRVGALVSRRPEQLDAGV